MINRTLASLALLGATFAPAVSSADSTGAITGYVINSATTRPVPGAAVIIARLPVAEDAARDSVIANRQGFFARLGLQPGTYAVTANVLGHSATCVIHDLYGGLNRSVKIYISPTNAEFSCVRERPSRTLVNPDEAADLYVVR
jgi:hypothetical protein